MTVNSTPFEISILAFKIFKKPVVREGEEVGSWNLPDSQLSRESKMEPNVATLCKRCFFIGA